jgi:quercetin 2,3-dioxygenase
VTAPSERRQTATSDASPTIEILPGKVADVGGLAVRRLLPRRARRTIGAWCFIDQYGPTAPDDTHGIEIGPHPHTGLQTVSWLFEGEALHRDSLGTEQLLRPGQLNLMTAGRGIAHSEENPSQRAGVTLGAQLWVALPDSTRNGPPAFEHHAELPVLGIGAAKVTVMMGSLGTVGSSARTDTPMVGLAVDAVQPGTAHVPLDPAFEHGVLLISGSLGVEGQPIGQGELAYLLPGREATTLSFESDTHALLLGGEPFGEQLVYSWNFVGRDRDEVRTAADEWNAGTDRFGSVASTLPRILAPATTSA